MGKGGGRRVLESWGREGEEGARVMGKGGGRKAGREEKSWGREGKGRV